MGEHELKRLNWGCGHRGVPGWINADRQPGRDIQMSCDIRGGLPLGDQSIDYIVSIHALEEIAYDDLPVALGELKRVLKAGGTLRLGLPDLLKGVEAFHRN